MSKRAERREAERLARRAAYQKLRQPAPAQTESPAAEPLATQNTDDLLARAQAFFDQPPTVSEAQIQANRANAQLSTGPVTAAGKATSSRNHTTHGLTAEPATGTPFKVLPSENQSAYDRALAGYKKEWQPATATELDLVHRLATHSWLRDRAIRLQDTVVGEGLSDRDALKKLTLLMRYQATHDRAYNKAFSDLMRLRSFQMREQKHAQTLQIRFESQQLKTAAHEARMEALHRKQSLQKSAQTAAQTVELTENRDMAASQAA